MVLLGNPGVLQQRKRRRKIIVAGSDNITDLLENAVYITDDKLQMLVNEFSPFVDLTSIAAGIDAKRGKLHFTAARDIRVCCVEEAERLCKMLGVTAFSTFKSGDYCKAGDVLIELTGCSSTLHSVSLPVRNLLEYSCGIATYTSEMVRQLGSIANAPVLLTMEKSVPGNRDFACKSVMAGGAMPRYFGYSDSFLVKQNHFAFFPEDVTIGTIFTAMKKRTCDKLLIVESETIDEAIVFASSGADGIQFDRLSVFELSEAVKVLRDEFPEIRILVSGGITVENIASYASTGVDALLTDSPYFARPVQLLVSMLMDGSGSHDLM